MVLAQTEQNYQVRKARDQMPTFHFVAEDDGEESAFGGLNHLFQRSAGGDQWTGKKVTVVVDSGAAENVMPKSMFSGISCTVACTH